MPNFLTLVSPRMGQQVIEAMSQPGSWGHMGMQLQSTWPQVTLVLQDLMYNFSFTSAAVAMI